MDDVVRTVERLRALGATRVRFGDGGAVVEVELSPLPPVVADIPAETAEQRRQRVEAMLFASVG